jgi:putative endonuclease
MSKQFYVYILTSKRNGTLYIGVTSNLPQRIHQHKDNQFDGFCQKYNIKKLVYFEPHDTAESAIAREKQIKKWNRAWKLKLVEKNNPQWEDLYNLILR